VLCGFERLRGPAPPLLLSTQRDLSAARTVEGRAVPAPSRSSAGRTVVEYALASLAPNRGYFCGFTPDSGTLVRFRTFATGPFSFTAAFASCAGGTRLVPMSQVSKSRVFDAIAALDPHVFIHMLAFDDGRHNAHGGFVVAQSGPLDRFVRPKGGPYSHEPPDQKNGQFATLHVDDTGAVLTATLQGHRHLGSGRSVPVPETRLQVRCQGGRCELQPPRPKSTTR
jgi:hypothetical protein